MPRENHAFRYRGHWCSKIGGRLKRLLPADRPYKEATIALAEALKLDASKSPSIARQWTVSDLCNSYLDKHSTILRANTVDAKKDAIRLLTAFAGDMLASKFTRLDASSFVDHLRKLPSRSGTGSSTDNSVRTRVKNAKSIFAWAVKQVRVLPDNPFSGVKLPHETNRKRVLTDQQFRLLMQCAPSCEFRQMLMFLRFTGARPMEAIGLTWDMVHLDKSVCIIPPDKHKTGHSGSKAKPRVLYLPAKIVRLVKHLLQRRGKLDEVFLREQRYYWSYASLRARFRRACRKAGLCVRGEKDWRRMLYAASWTENPKT
jgi:integrase